MILRRWNYKKHRYDPFEVPDNWNVILTSNDLDDLINCCTCGKELKFGDSYTSMRVHNNIGLGYCVCQNCYDKEWIIRKENGFDDD